jgi:hypothetical protein
MGLFLLLMLRIKKLTFSRKFQVHLNSMNMNLKMKFHNFYSYPNAITVMK